MCALHGAKCNTLTPQFISNSLIHMMAWESVQSCDHHIWTHWPPLEKIIFCAHHIALFFLSFTIYAAFFISINFCVSWKPFKSKCLIFKSLWKWFEFTLRFLWCRNRFCKAPNEDWSDKKRNACFQHFPQQNQLSIFYEAMFLVHRAQSSNRSSLRLPNILSLQIVGLSRYNISEWFNRAINKVFPDLRAKQKRRRETHAEVVDDTLRSNWYVFIWSGVWLRSLFF